MLWIFKKIYFNVDKYVLFKKIIILKDIMCVDSSLYYVYGLVGVYEYDELFFNIWNFNKL